jgi:excisionase family DNA binding protein
MKLNDIITENKRDENRDLNKAPPPEDGKMTTAQAAKRLNVTMGRIRQLIMNGELDAQRPEKGRRDNLLSIKDVQEIAKKKKKPGRPSKKNKDRD